MFPYADPLVFDPDALPVSPDHMTHIHRRPSVDVADDALALNYVYSDNAPYIPPQPMAHLHAPVPLPVAYAPPHSDSPRQPSPPSTQLVYPTALQDQPHNAASSANVLDYYAAAPQLLFPTPSELLTDLASPQAQHCHTRDPSPPALPSSENAVAANAAANKSESQRKARQRAVAQEIGFTPTDPDTISSHEKKRHYLECLEHYVLYLHEQLRLVQTPPLTLERVSTYRGLSSRSIRTLLVHMQNTNKSLHERTLAEEQVFLDLSAHVMTAHNAGLLRRHSVDVPGTNGPFGDHSAGYSSSGFLFDGIGMPTSSSSTGSPSAEPSPPGSDPMQNQTGNAFGTFAAM